MSKPNILLLFTDMQRADTIAALGNPVIQTPNLDRLVREGTAFTRCYSPSPVCIPARCCMHYGLYPQRTGLFTNGRMMDDNGRSCPEVLSGNGYRTAAIGKCHFTPDHNALRGFGQRITQEEIVSSYKEDHYREWLMEKGLDPVEPHGERGPMYYIPQPSRFREDAHPSAWIADQTIESIEAFSGDDSPWCLMSSFIHPHPPLTPPRGWSKLYPPQEVPEPHMPARAESLLTHINRTQNRYKWRDNGIDRNLLRTIKSYYYATISFVDYQIGRILESLEHRGILDQTLILFASDHGEYLGDYGCFGKRSMHDASARVPLLARLPGRFAPGNVCDSPASLVDIMPTMLAAAGIESPALDGADLKAVSEGTADREHVFSQWGKGRNAIYLIATRDWKYIYSAGEEKEILFDRQRDPLESRNAAADLEAFPVRNRLRQTLLQYLKRSGDTEAVNERGDSLEWKSHPPLRQRYLADNPDAGLLYQDEPEGLPETIGAFTFPRRDDDPDFSEAFHHRIFYGD
jgi:choline-sulfatase